MVVAREGFWVWDGKEGPDGGGFWGGDDGVRGGVGREGGGERRSGEGERGVLNVPGGRGGLGGR